MLERKASAARASAASLKCSSRKLPTLGVTGMPSAAISLVSQASHVSLCAMDLVDMVLILDRGDAGAHRRRLDVERAAKPVDAHRMIAGGA